MAGLSVKINVRMSLWFKALLFVMRVLVTCKIVRAETVAKVITRAGNYAFKYKVNNGLWKRLELFG